MKLKAINAENVLKLSLVERAKEVQILRGVERARQRSRKMGVVEPPSTRRVDQVKPPLGC